MLQPRHALSPAFWQTALLVIGAALLTGCDQLSERAGFPDPAKIEAEGKAIGGACRHAGRGLEDCYRLNREASKAAVYSGWKEMNEYMLKNNMLAVEPSIPPETFTLKPRKKKKADAEGEDHAENKAKKETPSDAADAKPAKEH